MKKLFFAILTLTLTFTLFSCLSDDPVELPTPTRPDLDLPVPDETVPFIPAETGDWRYDPNPNDDIYIYGGSFGNTSIILKLYDGKADIAFRVTEKSTAVELLNMDISRADYVCGTYYRISGLTYSKNGVGENHLVLEAEPFYVTSEMKITVPDGSSIGDYIAKRTEMLENAAKNKHINKEKLEEQKAYMRRETLSANGEQLRISLTINNTTGACKITSIQCNINGKQHKLTNYYNKDNIERTEIDFGSDNRFRTVHYFNKVYTTKIEDTYVHGDASITRTEAEYKEGELISFTFYGEKGAKELYKSFDHIGKVESIYYVEGDRGYEISYGSNGQKTFEEVYEVSATTKQALRVLSRTSWDSFGKLRYENYNEGNKNISKTYSNGILSEYTEKSVSESLLIRYYNDGVTKKYSERSVSPLGYDGFITVSKQEWYANGILKYEYSAEANGNVNYERTYDDNGVLISDATDGESSLSAEA